MEGVRPARRHLLVEAEDTIIHPLSLDLIISLRIASPVPSDPLIRVAVNIPSLRCTVREADVSLVLRLTQLLVGEMSSVHDDVFAEKDGLLHITESRYLLLTTTSK